ncbi:MAG: ribbon-helix-helix protein, CopG family [Solirubrobacteraceae bacterium]|nr:ribbon-helix-helix protein, CopG family [Solirubrobacteraceae bacterium]
MKRRLSASIDEELLAAAERAVAEGRAPSVSALVEEALAERMAQVRRLEAAEELFAWIDREWGPMTEAERQAADVSISANTIQVRPDRGAPADGSGPSADIAA